MKNCPHKEWLEQKVQKCFYDRVCMFSFYFLMNNQERDTNDPQ